MNTMVQILHMILMNGREIFGNSISEVYPESADPQKRTEAKINDKAFENKDAINKKNIKKNKQFIPSEKKELK